MNAPAALRNAALAAFAVFHAACVADSLGSDPGPLTSRFGDWWWPARWKMFTTVEHSVSRARFEVSRDAERWVVFPMEEALPARWESGHRWERPAIWQKGEFAKTWLVQACGRSGAKFARLGRERRTKVLGEDTLLQPPTVEYPLAIECPVFH